MADQGALRELLRPVAMVVEDQGEVPDKGRWRGTPFPFNGVQFLWRGVRQAGRLRREHEARTGVRYDVAARVSLDAHRFPFISEGAAKGAALPCPTPNSPTPLPTLPASALSARPVTLSHAPQTFSPKP